MRFLFTKQIEWFSFAVGDGCAVSLGKRDSSDEDGSLCDMHPGMASGFQWMRGVISLGKSADPEVGILINGKRAVAPALAGY